MSIPDLRIKMEQLATKVAEELLSSNVDLEVRIDGLKTLSAYYATVKNVDFKTGGRPPGKWGDLARSIGADAGSEEEEYGEA